MGQSGVSALPSYNMKDSWAIYMGVSYFHMTLLLKPQPKIQVTI